MLVDSTIGPKVGYLVGPVPEPKPIHISQHHVLVAGTTGEAGKTTAIEGLISRWSGKMFIVFRTKRGELEFKKATRLLPHFRQPPKEQMWRYVEAMIESVLQEKNRIIRSTIMQVCEGKSTLDSVWAEVQKRRRKAKGFELSMLTQLDEYMKIVLPELKKHEFSEGLVDKDNYAPVEGVYVMDLTEFSTDLQSMVIGATAEFVLTRKKDTCLVIPEAWEHIPNAKNTPAKAQVEALVRKGRVLGNFVIIDSQDVVGIDPVVRKNVANWILGKQTESLEAQKTLDLLPLAVSYKPKVYEVQTLKLGQFFVVTGGKVIKTFAQPEWMGDTDAIDCAEDPDLAYSLHPNKYGDMNYGEPVSDYTPPPGIEENTAILPGEFIKVPPKPITTDGVIETEQARVTVFQRQVVKPDLDESTLEGRIGVLMADGFFDIGRGTKDIFGELERHYPGRQTGYDNFRKNICWKAMQFWSARPYGYIEKKGEVWQITELGKKYLSKIVVEA